MHGMIVENPTSRSRTYALRLGQSPSLIRTRTPAVPAAEHTRHGCGKPNEPQPNIRGTIVENSTSRSRAYALRLGQSPSLIRTRTPAVPAAEHTRHNRGKPNEPLPSIRTAIGTIALPYSNADAGCPSRRAYTTSSPLGDTRRAHRPVAATAPRCKSASSKYPHVPAFLGSRADPRHLRADAWQRSAAVSAA